MKVFQKQWQQVVNAPIEEVWQFFSKPGNLQKITPNDMQFEILSEITDIKLYQGMMIQYKVSPFPLYKTGWLTEITALQDLAYFIDEQRSGPFKLWHHQHHFSKLDPGKTKMTDILHYAIPFGVIGHLANALAVSRRIERIFAYRESIIPTYFPGH